MRARKAFKFKLKPNKEQVEEFNQFSGNARFVYSALLAWSSETYKESGRNTVGRSPMFSNIIDLKKNTSGLSFPTPKHCRRQEMT